MIIRKIKPKLSHYWAKITEKIVTNIRPGENLHGLSDRQHHFSRTIGLMLCFWCAVYTVMANQPDERGGIGFSSVWIALWLANAD